MAFFKKTRQKASQNGTMQIVLNDKQFDATQSLSTKDVYFRLCACLDREIELVWKRAVFLTAFLIAAFAGYGGLIAAYLGAEKHNAGDFAIVSIAAIGIAFVGMALSDIWIMMAKGSKAWQEHYEKVIECFVAHHGSKDELQDICASGNYLQGSSDPIIKKYWLTREKISEGLLNCFGGPYSVSKIVIGIGQGSLLVWVIVALVHLSLVFWKYETLLSRVIHSPSARGKVIQGLAVIGIFAILVLIIIIAMFFCGKRFSRFQSVSLSRLHGTIPETQNNGVKSTMNAPSIPFLFRMFGPATQSSEQNNPPNTESFGPLIKEETLNLSDQVVSSILRKSFDFAIKNLNRGDDIQKITLVIPDSSAETSESVWSVILTTQGKFFKIHARKLI